MKKIIILAIFLACNRTDLYAQSTTILPTGISQPTLQIGVQSLALGQYSSSLGLGVTARSYASSAFGRYNLDQGSSTTWVPTDPIFTIGIGTSDILRNNAFTVLKNGDVFFGNATFSFLKNQLSIKNLLVENVHIDITNDPALKQIMSSMAGYPSESGDISVSQAILYLLKEVKSLKEELEILKKK